MIEKSSYIGFLLLLVLSILFGYSYQLQSSQAETLLRIRLLLNYPSLLSSWNNATDFCNIEPSESLAIVCYEESITQLHITGENGTPALPENFSIDSFFTTLVKLPNLKVLKLVSLGLWGPLPDKITRFTSLEILNLTSNFFHGTIPAGISMLTDLQTLILDGNSFTGRLPSDIGSLSDVAVLSVKNNLLHGSLPESVGRLENLRVLALASNNFSGEVPDISNLRNLQVLDLEDNALGPRFPVVGDKVQSIVLRNNKFTLGIPEKVQSYYQLEHFDISSNRFIGPFPVTLLFLPSIAYLNIADNRFTGMLFADLSCNNELSFVNLSDNLLTGKLPSCLLYSSRNKVVSYAGNCLSTGDGKQNPVSLCKNEALAVGFLPQPKKQKRASKLVLFLSISGGLVMALIMLGITFLVVRNFFANRSSRNPLTTYIAETSSTGYTSKLLKDARYITQAMKLGALGLPAYRTFSLEELEEATNNFDTSTSIGEGSHGQLYRGRLQDGSYVAIRCLKMKRNHSTQYYMPHIELISKLRHHHLVSALGHCFGYYLDDSSVSRLFLIFEYVPNGSIRTWISDKHAGQKLTWAQRIAAATGLAKGIQFLHTGIVPGLFSNNLKITDILMDQNLGAKISSYNLPLLEESTGKDNPHKFPGGSKDYKNTRENHQEKSDIYDFGVILLEIISGKPVNSMAELQFLRDQLQESAVADDPQRKSVLDPAVSTQCSTESSKTMIEICCRCLLKDPADRPSIEDILWNLQFAAQVQDSRSSEGSPISPLQSSRLQLAIQE